MAESELPASALVDAIDDALLVVEGDEIRECNEAFEAIVTPDGGDCTGPIDSTLAPYPDLRDSIEHRDEGIVSVPATDGTAYYELTVSEMETGVGEFDLVLLHDVTGHHRRQRALERENEHLDQFASIISHDLRNPLDVAIGRTTIVSELVDDPEILTHVEEIEQSHSRMLRIIDDVLTLARQGQSIDEKTDVDVEAVARNAWSHVETDGADLDVRADLTVLADPERLGQVFENLFRNSLDHGTGETSDSLTVTVGGLDDGEGFYVADDGVGIDPAERDRVLEAGYSRDDEGTGLGLGIVSNIARAHQWDVTVTASEAGGARFEFTGVDVVDE